jgi:hypothetical protein
MMEGVALSVSATMLFAGLLLLSSSIDLGILLVSTFWAPYGGYKYAQRVCGRPSTPSKRPPVAPVFEGPLPVAAVVDEDPAPAS